MCKKKQPNVVIVADMWFSRCASVYLFVHTSSDCVFPSTTDLFISLLVLYSNQNLSIVSF